MAPRTNLYSYRARLRPLPSFAAQTGPEPGAKNGEPNFVLTLAQASAHTVETMAPDPARQKNACNTTQGDDFAA